MSDTAQTLVYLQGIVAVFVATFGGWHWVRGTDTYTTRVVMASCSVMYAYLFIAAMIALALS